MKIDAYMKVSQLYQTNKPKKAMQTENKSNADTLEISNFGKEYQIAKQAAKNTEPVREDRVQDIQRQLAAGTYHVSIEDVAEKLAGKLLGE